MIELYSRAGCEPCVILKSKLLDLGISNYIPCDVSVKEHLDALKQLGFRSIPVVLKKDDQGNVLDTLQGSKVFDKVLIDFFKEN
jgi:glutaredoxin